MELTVRGSVAPLLDGAEIGISHRPAINTILTCVRTSASTGFGTVRGHIKQPSQFHVGHGDEGVDEGGR